MGKIDEKEEEARLLTQFDDLPIFNQRLKKLREKRGWSGTEAAHHLRVNQSIYWKYENGDTLPSIAFIRRCAEVFSVSSDYLLGLSNRPRGLYREPGLTVREREMLKNLKQKSLPEFVLWANRHMPRKKAVS